MPRRQILILLAAAGLLPGPLTAAEFSGQAAFEHTRQAVAFGPRPPGSPALARLRAYIVSKVKALGAGITEDAFTAQTPIGPIRMVNVIARFPGTSGKAVAVTGHYDTKLLPGIRFVGANDGGSSTGFLLELARVVAGKTRRDDVYLVWFDGEEAIGEWSATDGVHGSRHLAARWEREGVLRRLKALINVDMIGDRDLGILREQQSSPHLLSLVWKVAAGLGYSRYFLDTWGAVEDDHMPFVKKGVPALNLIDFDFPWWHTDGDTLDKVSPLSLEIVGRVVVETLHRLEAF